MQELLEATREDRRKYFQEATARSKNIKNVIVIEKDFWVCWTLNQIFSHPALSMYITFKGGTSLSKCYNMIDRFSEDIDLTLSKQYIGITTENDPATITGSNQRSIRLKQLTEKVKNKITNAVKPLLTEEFRKNLSIYFNENEWRLETDEKDEQSLIFHYPSCFEKKSDGYIQSSILSNIIVNNSMIKLQENLSVMSATEPLSQLIGINPTKLSKEEKILLEIELFSRICEELKEVFRQQHKEYFHLIKFNTEMENIMLKSKLIRLSMLQQIDHNDLKEIMTKGHCQHKWLI